jgi:Mlc titration factor MtfA (ptsG expression regulator)
MGYYLGMMAFLFALMALWLFWQAWRRYRQMRLLKRIEEEPFPAHWEEWLQKTSHYPLLPEVERKKVQKRLRYFMELKEFRPVKTELSEEMKVIISFYACLTVLGRPEECYEILQTILIYPNVVIAPRKEQNGWIVREEEALLEGESAGDTVVIAWHEARRDAYHTWPHNVIIHEFAHVLDFEDGAVDGVPPLMLRSRQEWLRVISRRYEALKERVEENRDWGEYRLIGAYAATNEAEFFAVTTELFFQRAATLKKHFPDLYREYRDFYNLDTAEIFGDIDRTARHCLCSG